MLSVWSYIFCGGDCCFKLCFCRLIGINYIQQIRITYCLIQIVFQAIALIVILGGRVIFSPLKSLMECSDAELDTCLNFGVIYRISLSLVIVQFILGVCLLFRNSFARIVNEGVWPIKIFLTFLLFSLSLIIPDTIVRTYGWITKFSGTIVCFLIFVALSDVSYVFSRFLFSSFHSSDFKIKWGSIIVFLTSFLYSVALVMVAVNSFYYWDTSCPFSIVIIITVILVCLLMSLCSLIRTNKNSNQFVSSFFCAVYTIYAWQLQSDYDEYCNDSDRNQVLYGINVGVTAFWAFTFYLYLGLMTKEASATSMSLLKLLNLNRCMLPSRSVFQASENKKKSSTSRKKSKSKPIKDASDDDDSENSTELKNIPFRKGVSKKTLKSAKIAEDDVSILGKDNRAYTQNHFLAFHFVLMLFGSYMCLVWTEWHGSEIGEYVYQDSVWSLALRFIAMAAGALFSLLAAVSPHKSDAAVSGDKTFLQDTLL